MKKLALGCALLLALVAVPTWAQVNPVWTAVASTGTIDEAALGACLALSGRAPPDLFIRTGGDRRISNFMLWQMAYTELWFTETLWPELDAQLLQAAVDDFAGRERRFGLISAQVSESTATALNTVPSADADTDIDRDATEQHSNRTPA